MLGRLRWKPAPGLIPHSPALSWSRRPSSGRQPDPAPRPQDSPTLQQSSWRQRKRSGGGCRARAEPPAVHPHCWPWRADGHVHGPSPRQRRDAADLAVRAPRSGSRLASPTNWGSPGGRVSNEHYPARAWHSQELGRRPLNRSRRPARRWEDLRSRTRAPVPRQEAVQPGGRRAPSRAVRSSHGGKCWPAPWP